MLNIIIFNQYIGGVFFEKKKLYLVNALCDGMMNSFHLVGVSSDEIKKKVEDMYKYDYIEELSVKKITEVDGYEIILEKKN